MPHPEGKGSRRRFAAKRLQPWRDLEGRGADLVDRERGAARKRLEHFAHDLDQGFGHLRRLSDRSVERRFGKIALKLEQLGRRFGGRQAAERGGRGLERLATIIGGFLGQRFDALGGSAALGNQRLDITLGEIGRLGERLGALLDC